MRGLVGMGIRQANRHDLEELKEYLAKAGLSAEGLTEETASYFLLLENDEDCTWRGTLGIEPFPGKGLLRSLVVDSGQAQNDILHLFQHALVLAKENSLQDLYMATNKHEAVSFFKILGFQLLEEEELPEDLSRSEHIKHITAVENSLFLKLSL
jgi:N-acetylglutamate synthase-like GNAT family acetyltransferase